MKETGLMFKAPLVHAILAGQKTQTRRIVKWKGLQKGLNLGFSGLRAGKTGDNWVLESNTPTSSEWRCTPTPCPFGKPGDRIYVRETWQGPLLSNKEWEDHYFSDEEALPRRFETPAYCQYAADGEPPPEFTTMDDETVARWKPSIHMPKWAARIWLEITGVRVERLQDISNEDAIAEGVNRISHGREGDYYSAVRNEQHPKNWTYPDDAFRELWDSTTGRPALPANTNSKRYARVKRWLDTHPDTTGWAANPWVWVIDFKTISTTGRPA